MFKKFFTLILSLVLLYPLLSNFCNANAEKIPKPEDLHKKSEVEHLNNLRHAYSFGNFTIANDKKTDEQFLSNSLLFYGFFTDHPIYKDLLISFDSDSHAKKFLGKSIDIYGIGFGNNCEGGTPGKTQCMYGGVTPHENNIMTNDKNIPINLWLDGKQTEVAYSTVTTNKKIVTVQELDAKVRKYLSDKYKIYETDIWGGRFKED
ncbi:exotoxin OB-fold domain-containing protein [Staphylococcus aureus]|uniref:exotoxin OB-fold domain-containing protein n=1 Tax=Staphylococcus aureus TaxID=1280 RepID=UPI0029352C20|nr:exotoxin OB-fold domain-containing protein [Staphylococcus aureus]